MALEQAGEKKEICTSFSDELTLWISHILKRKIKFGKIKIRKTEEYSATPADFVLKFLVSKIYSICKTCIMLPFQFFVF